VVGERRGAPLTSIRKGGKTFRVLRLSENKPDGEVVEGPNGSQPLLEKGGKGNTTGEKNVPGRGRKEAKPRSVLCAEKKKKRGRRLPGAHEGETRKRGRSASRWHIPSPGEKKAFSSSLCPVRAVCQEKGGEESTQAREEGTLHAPLASEEVQGEAGKFFKGKRKSPSSPR